MQDRSFTLKYVGMAYLIGLAYVVPIIFLLYYANINFDQLFSFATFLSLSYLLYPLAKYAFDNFGGFYILEKSQYRPGLWRAYTGLSLVIFLLSIPLAPIGLIFAATNLITRKKA